MDRIDWNVTLLLIGDEPNQIGESEYVIGLISVYKRKQKTVLQEGSVFLL